MKPFYFCLAALFLAFAAPQNAQAYTDTGDLPKVLQVEPAGSTWDTVVADAKAQSTGASSGGTPIYHSTQLEETTFIGDFTADSDTTNLAIFSDDGCDVYVDGAKIWSAKDAPQALPDLPHSLHVLPITLTAGQTYHIEIDYSNVIYTGNGDVDGVTLFAYNDAPPAVTLTADDPGDPDEFQTVTSSLHGTVDHLPSGHFDTDLTATWHWPIAGVTHSDTVDGVFDGTGVDTTLFSVVDAGPDSTDPLRKGTGTFIGEFDLDGFYEIECQATVSYHDSRTGEDLGPYGPGATGDVFLGDNGDEPPAPTTPSSKGLLPAGAPTGKHKKVKTNGIQIYKDGVLVTGQTINCYAGEHITLTVQTPATLSSAQWYLDPNGSPIYNWTVGANTAYMTTIAAGEDIHQKTINLYWLKSGSSVEARYGGNVPYKNTTKYITNSVYFNIIKPSYIVSTPVSTVQAYSTSDKSIIFLGLGNLVNHIPGVQYKGIEFNANVTNLYGGTIQWVQVIYADYYLHFTPEIRNTRALDTIYPYPLFDPPQSTEDSPTLQHNQNQVSSDSRTFHAIMWLMWKPNMAGAIFAPLETFEWGWSGSASQNNFHDWQLDAGTGSVEPVNATSNAAVEPEWDEVSPVKIFKP